MWQNGFQSTLEISKCGRVDYKVRQGLQNVARLQSELVQKLDQKFIEKTFRFVKQRTFLLIEIEICGIDGKA